MTIGQALGVEPSIVHIPNNSIVLLSVEQSAGFLGDKAKSVLFDNTKIKGFVPDYVATIPFREVIRRTLHWFDADPAHKTVNAQSNEFMDECQAAY
jgi:hypothetical protein